MQVDFNNVRKQAIYAYESLVSKLNYSIIRDDEQYAKPNDVWHGQIVNIKGYVLVDADDLKKHMDSLRSLIGAIAMTYKEGDEEFKDMFEEVYPEDDQHMPIFNEEVEEE